MRLQLALAAALVLSLEPGCTHFSTASGPTMDETGEPSMPPPVLPPRERWTRRKSLLATGIVIGGVGAALLLGGGGGYGVAVRDRDEAIKSSCDHPSVDCGVFTLNNGAADVGTMIAGGVHVVAGLVFTLVGLSRHD
jgi:hypothetical protein